MKHISPAIGLDFDRDIVGFDKPLTDFTEEDLKSIKLAHISKHKKGGVTDSIEAFLKLTPGEVGLVRGGATPVALVRVTGPYQFDATASVSVLGEGDPLWFRHRFPIQVIQWYEDYIKKHPDAKVEPHPQGTFKPLKNPNLSTHKAIKVWLNCVESESRMSKMIDILRQFNQIILIGPPGTGKTFEAQRIAAALTDRDPKRINFLQFHPSYNYEDLVRGLKSETEGASIRYMAKHGVFGEACKAAERAGDAPCVLIIDEINRANVAAVFGELLYALEYRGKPVRTPYEIDGDTSLTVPENLFVIGTMNTADRSIGHIDYAVRRRFAFVACAPDRSVIEAHSFADSKDRALALEMFDAVAGLFEGTTSFLSAGHHASDLQVGHTYFIGEDMDGQKLRSRFSYQVEPLLQEYLADGVFKPEAEKEIQALAARYRELMTR